MGNNRQAFQSITATLVVSGEQDVDIDSHGTGGPGSYITVRTPNLMLTVHDCKAARTYARAWADAAESALYLPQLRTVQLPAAGRHLPGVVVHAHGADTVTTVYSPVRAELILRIGYLTFLVLDRDAHLSMNAAWQQVRAMSTLILPPLLDAGPPR